MVHINGRISLDFPKPSVAKGDIWYSLYYLSHEPRASLQIAFRLKASIPNKW